MKKGKKAAKSTDESTVKTGKKKRTVFTIAKEIRDTNEPWQMAIKRARREL